jgi:hypothetical protein
MIQHVNAIYEHGVLKPLGPLDLRDQECVALSVSPLPTGEQRDTSSPAIPSQHTRRSGLVGLFADEPELLDDVMEAVYERRSRPWRIND